MQFEGKTVRVSAIEEGIYELVFDRQGDAINKFDTSAIAELREAVDMLTAAAAIRGLILSSAKDSFIVGADITEFISMFNGSEQKITDMLMGVHGIFNAIEDLPCPVVAAINGLALGGGFEVCLAADYRVMAERAKVGLPEVKLGIFPGWGGSVRMPRLIGIDNANDWVCGGGEKSARAALVDGAVDAVVAADQLKFAAVDLIRGCIAGKYDYMARRAEKKSPVRLNQIERSMAFESAKGVVGSKAGPHYPAPMTALKAMEKHVGLSREEAIPIEVEAFVGVAKTDVAAALIGIFMKDQAVKKVGKIHEAQAEPVKRAAVLGAGIMGGGIAYQSAVKGTPIVMKDIESQALQLGLSEASKLLNAQVSRGRMKAADMAAVLNQISPTLNYGDFGNIDLVVEAVVENPTVKKSVLAEVEAVLPDGAVLTSNTSTISITELATALEKPENFCGMHFFNPVHKMPLVEVIRGEKSSEQTVSRTVAYARAMGKTPIVVNDCPGFFVNRVLFPYFGGFSALVRDGADFIKVDKVMEQFGWPMGPAYLLDVVGIDTAYHADAIMAQGFPDRMAHDDKNAIDEMYALQRFGQKNERGFYRYALDRKGRQKKLIDDEVPALLAGLMAQRRDFSDEEIVERMMIPLCIETVRCLEEGIIASPAEADMALVYGLGFPAFRGGVLHYLDQMGLAGFCAMAAKYDSLGGLYQPTEKMKQMAAAGEKYFG